MAASREENVMASSNVNDPTLAACDNRPQQKKTFSTELLNIHPVKVNPLVISRQKGSSVHSSGQLKTFQLPQSSVLRQVQAFLPQMAAADEELQERLKVAPSDELDIEVIENSDGPVIEMNLALVEEDGDSDESDSGDSSSCGQSDSGSDSGDEEANMKPLFEDVSENNFQTCQRNAGQKSRPKIEELSSHNSEIVDETE